MGTDTFENVQPGDVFAVVTYLGVGRERVTKVTIAKTSKNTMTDTTGRRWTRRSGRSVGGSTWDKVYLHPWTSEHDTIAQNRMLDQRYEAAMAALGAGGVVWSRVSVAAVKSALPHLEAAVKAVRAVKDD